MAICSIVADVVKSSTPISDSCIILFCDGNVSCKVSGSICLKGSGKMSFTVGGSEVGGVCGGIDEGIWMLRGS